MALRNRKEAEERKLKGVDLSTNPSKVPIGKFTSLQNWIPGKINKIIKKRGVAALSTTAQAVTVPTACTDICPDNFAVSAQALNLVDVYGPLPIGNIGGKIVASWGYVGSDGTIYQLVADSNAATYDSDGTTLYRIDPDGTETAVSKIQEFAAATTNTRNGHSDEASYAFTSGSPGEFWYFSIDNNTKTTIAEQPGDGTWSGGAWAKAGTSIYLATNDSVNDKYLREHTVGSGAFVRESTALTGYDGIASLQAVGSNLYAVVTDAGDTKLAVVRLSDLTVTAEYTLTPASIAVWVVDSTFAYFITQNADNQPLGIHYIQMPSGSITTVDSSVPINTGQGASVDAVFKLASASGIPTLYFRNRYLYLGVDNSGFTSAHHNIVKIGPIFCV